MACSADDGATPGTEITQLPKWGMRSACSVLDAGKRPDLASFWLVNVQMDTRQRLGTIVTNTWGKHMIFRLKQKH